MPLWPPHPGPAVSFCRSEQGLAGWSCAESHEVVACIVRHTYHFIRAATKHVGTSISNYDVLGLCAGDNCIGAQSWGRRSRLAFMRHALRSIQASPNHLILKTNNVRL